MSLRLSVAACMFDVPTSIGRTMTGLCGILNLQFHLSVEPGLEPYAAFDEQKRTGSGAGERGSSAGDGIYTTHDLAWWGTQLAYEDVGEFPRHVYVVAVREPGAGSIWAAHQDVSPPEDVVVLTRIAVMDDGDEVPPYSRISWLAERWIASDRERVDECLRSLALGDGPAPGTAGP